MGGAGGDNHSSSNGVDFTQNVGSPAWGSSDITSLVAFGGSFYGMPYTSNGYISADGLTWPTSFTPPFDGNHLVRGSDSWLMTKAAATPRYYMTSDLITWGSDTFINGISGSLLDAFGGPLGTWAVVSGPASIALGSAFAYSSDDGGLFNASADVPYDRAHYCVRLFNGQWIVGGQRNSTGFQELYTLDLTGSTWATTFSGSQSGSYFRKLTDNGTTIVAVGGVGPASATDCCIAYSANGNSWTAATSPVQGWILDVTWSPTLGLFIAVGNGLGGPFIITSPTGATWTSQTVPTSNALNAVAAV